MEKELEMEQKSELGKAVGLAAVLVQALAVAKLLAWEKELKMEMVLVDEWVKGSVLVLVDEWVKGLAQKTAVQLVMDLEVMREHS